MALFFKDGFFLGEKEKMIEKEKTIVFVFIITIPNIENHT